MTKFGWDTSGTTAVEQLKEHIEGKTIVMTGPTTSGVGGEAAMSIAHGNPEKLVLLVDKSQSPNLSSTILQRSVQRPTSPLCISAPTIFKA
jgi:FlaA1/EpsC-like NDP-sugar epimerase